MLFTISGKHIDIPQAVKDYAEEKTSKLPKFYNVINQVEVKIDGKEGSDIALEIIARGEHKKMFVANPDRYVPQYGGFCAFGVTQVTKFDGDPLLWNIHNGKLYVNATPALQQKWLGKGLVNVVGNNLDKNIAEANKIWPTISKAKPEALFTAWAARQ